MHPISSPLTGYFLYSPPAVLHIAAGTIQEEKKKEAHQWRVDGQKKRGDTTNRSGSETERWFVSLSDRCHQDGSGKSRTVISNIKNDTIARRMLARATTINVNLSVSLFA